jgi:PEP-CTERM motif-containing protein
MRRPIWQSIVLQAIAGLGLVLGLNGWAMADLASCTDEGGFFSLVDTPNAALSSFTGPYGEICVTLTDSNTAQIVADTFNPPYLMGATGALALNFNGAVTLDGAITGDAGSGPFTVGSGNDDGFGSFNFRISDFDGFSHATSSLTFSVDLTSGTWSSAANVLALNANGADAAMHIFVNGTSDLPQCGGSNCTGFAAEGPGTITENPEPGVLSLLGLGLFGMGFTMRRRKA